jgi:hypothetical protein
MHEVALCAYANQLLSLVAATIDVDHLLIIEGLHRDFKHDGVALMLVGIRHQLWLPRSLPRTAQYYTTII